MPIYQYECPECGYHDEAIFPISVMERGRAFFCGTCECEMVHIIVASGHYCSNQDAGWLKTVVDVVDKESTKRETKEFLKNPNRQNYKAWMKAEGIRPLEDGERSRPPKFDVRKHVDEIMRLRH